MKTGELIAAMAAFDAPDTARIGHFLKVYGFAKAIGEQEGLSPREQEILEAAAVTHDIGIRLSREKYGSAAGEYQQLEGPPAARELLTRLGADGELIERVCWLIGHHHTYDGIQGRDYRILVEADFLVNLAEGEAAPGAVRAARQAVFRTKTGTAFLTAQFPLPEEPSARP